MAHPKRRHSNSRTGKRRSHDALSAPNLTDCPRCGQARRVHAICDNCGHYGTRPVIDLEGI